MSTYIEELGMVIENLASLVYEGTDDVAIELEDAMAVYNALRKAARAVK